MRTRKPVLFGAALAAALVALGAVAVPAAKKKPVNVNVTSTLTITPVTQNTSIYRGQLSAEPIKLGPQPKRGRKQARRCLSEELVSVIHGTDPIKDFIIGTEETTASGAWEIVGNRAPSGDPITLHYIGGKKGRAKCLEERKTVQHP